MESNFAAEAPRAIADELMLQLQNNEEQVSFALGIQVGRRPRLGAQRFALCLFYPMHESAIGEYEETHGVGILHLYRNILRQLNGAWIYRLVLFGVPPSMVANPGKIKGVTGKIKGVRR